MSISYSELNGKNHLKWLVCVQLNREQKQQLPFPVDYKYFGCVLPTKFVSSANQFLNFHIRSDDIWVVSFPKSGTTWTMNIVWQLKNGLNFTVHDIPSTFKFFEESILRKQTGFSSDDKSIEFELNKFSNEASPRLLKSHLPAHLLPKDIWNAKPKLIYVYRNAKDVAISLYHMLKTTSTRGYNGTLEDFFDDFLDGHTCFGSFYDHIQSFQQMRGLEHVLFVKYEDMNANTFESIKKLNDFLGYNYSCEQLQQLVEHVSFKNMRDRFLAKPNHFYK